MDEIITFDKEKKKSIDFIEEIEKELERLSPDNYWIIESVIYSMNKMNINELTKNIDSEIEKYEQKYKKDTEQITRTKRKSFISNYYWFFSYFNSKNTFFLCYKLKKKKIKKHNQIIKE